MVIGEGGGTKGKKPPKADAPRRPNRSKRSRGRENAADRLAAQKRAAREARLRRQRLRSIVMLAALVIVVTGSVVGISAVYRSQLFAVENVIVVGGEQLSTERILEIADIPEDATLIRFPGAAIAMRLESDPWISDAQVTRDFPDSMRIRITERVPVAYVDMGGSDIWLVDAEGYVIGEQTVETTRTLMVIRDLEGVDPRVGERTMSEPLLNALNVLMGLSDELKAIVRAISAPTIDRTTLMTTDEIAVVVGSSEDIEIKDEITRTILEEQAGKVVYINVRTVDRPVWRGLTE